MGAHHEQDEGLVLSHLVTKLLSSWICTVMRHGMHVFWLSGKCDVSSSITLAGRKVLPKSLNIRPLLTYRLRPLCKIQYIRFFLVYQNSCLTFSVGVACLGKQCHFSSSLGGVCYAHKTSSVTEQPSTETKIFVILLFDHSTLKALRIFCNLTRACTCIFYRSHAAAVSLTLIYQSL